MNQKCHTAYGSLCKSHLITRHTASHGHLDSTPFQLRCLAWLATLTVVASIESQKQWQSKLQCSNVNSSKFPFPAKQTDATYNTGMKDSEFMFVSVQFCRQETMMAKWDHPGGRLIWQFGNQFCTDFQPRMLAMGTHLVQQSPGCQARHPYNLLLWALEAAQITTHPVDRCQESVSFPRIKQKKHDPSNVIIIFRPGCFTRQNGSAR